MKGKLLREAETPHYCEDCGEELKANDHVTHTLDMTRIWHTRCFEASLTPFDEWPKSGNGSKSR